MIVTGYGLTTALGNDPEQVFHRLISGQNAARPWDDLNDFPISIACRIDDPAYPVGAGRGRALALDAVNQALCSAGQLDGNGGVFVGSTMGESAGFEENALGGEHAISEIVASTFADHIADEVYPSARRVTYGTACAAGNYAIGNAAAAIRRGELDWAIAGGVEPFSKIAQLGFARLRAMTPDVCRPFDRNRRGMQVAEGAAFVFLESDARVRDRGAEPLARITGLGLSCDAFHPTAPRKDARGVVKAVRDAMAHSGASDVGWISAHGTGTGPSDAAEVLALGEVFSQIPPVSSIKGALGHAMGAAAAIEAVVAIMAMERNVIPANTNLEDPEFDLDFVLEPREIKVDRILSCAYGFGGLNSALVLERA